MNTLETKVIFEINRHVSAIYRKMKHINPTTPIDLNNTDLNEIRNNAQLAEEWINALLNNQQELSNQQENIPNNV